jgi:hypothetical protein
MIDVLLLRRLESFHASRLLDVGPGYNALERIAVHSTGASQ